MSEVNTTSAGELTRSLSSAIQTHPLPAALIGMGLVWLFSGGKSLISAGGGETDVRDVTKRASSNATSFGASNSRAFAAASIADLMDRQPLVLGAIGLSVGAAMAAALPSTAVEADLLGQASADLQARTREIAGQSDRPGGGPCRRRHGGDQEGGAGAGSYGRKPEAIDERRQSKSSEHRRPVHRAIALRHLIPACSRAAPRIGQPALRARTV